jgi:hypothetical protein
VSAVLAGRNESPRQMDSVSGVPPSAAPFVQRLEGLDLSIEKATERTPDRHRYHVFLEETLVDSFRGLPAAQERFRKLRDESGWKPPDREQLTAEEKLRRQQAAKDRLDYLEYWGTSHQFRGGGKPKRRQR